MDSQAQEGQEPGQLGRGTTASPFWSCHPVSLPQSLIGQTQTPAPPLIEEDNITEASPRPHGKGREKRGAVIIEKEMVSLRESGVYYQVAQGITE